LISPLWQERIGAGAVLGIGLLLVHQGYSMPLGRLASFGPGLFPLMLGALLVLFSVALFLTAGTRSAGAGGPMPWRAMIFVSLGMFAFASLIRSYGLVPATVSLVVLCSMGGAGFRPLTAVLVAAGLSLAGVAIFIWGLGLALVPWRF
jgi:hypothetical protein